MTVISDEEDESKKKGIEIYQPSRSRGGKKKVKERKRKLVFYPLLDPLWNYLNTTFPGALKKKVPMNPKKKQHIMAMTS